MVLFVLLCWVIGVIVIGTTVGALVGLRRDIGRIADVLERAYERDRLR